MKLPLKNTYFQQFLEIFLPIALIFTLACIVFIFQHNRSHLEEYILKQDNTLKIAATTMLRDISTIIHDTETISHTPALANYLESRSKEDLDFLSKTLLALSKSSYFYSQIRFLDASGMELSRINGVGKNCYIVPKQDLQHKGHRYYIAEARTLEPGEIYISPLDLNMERGKVELPQKPVIRFIKAIYNKEKILQGFVSLNYLADFMLYHLIDVIEHNKIANFMLLNHQGDFLVAPNVEDEWGFMFDRPALFANRHPQTWSYLKSHGSGTYEDESSLYIFYSIYPRWNIKQLNEGSLTPLTLSNPPGNFESNRWLLVFKLNQAQKREISRPDVPVITTIIAGLTLCLVIFSLLIAKSRTERLIELSKNRAITDSSHEAIIMLDNAEKITFWNPAAEMMFGYSYPEALNRNITTLLTPGDLREPLSKVLTDHVNPDTKATPKDHHQVLIVQKKNGATFLVEISISDVKINNQWQKIFLIRDISIKKATESHLRKLSLAVEESPVSIVITDKKGTIEYVNPKFCEVSQYSAEEAIGANPRILKSGQQSAEHYKHMWRTLLSGQEWHGEFANRRKNGEVYWERASISPLRDEEGGITHFVAIKEDISHEKEVLENLTKAKKEAERANKAKSDFVANMSHEIRTPMNAIIGLSELALDMDMASEPKNYFNKIHQAGRSLLAIINDILDFSKIEAGEFTVSPATFDIDELVDRLANLFGSRIWNKKLELLFQIDEDVPRTLIADDMRLSQILINLIGNALKFTEQGEILVTVQRVTKEYEPLVLEFSVKDSGIGISQERIQDLFSPFHQVDSSTSRKYGGTGLGLTISKQLVELMKGKFEVHSELGKGSTFSFSMPCKREEDTKSPRYEFTLPHSLQNAKILVADDNEKVCHIITSNLKLFSLRPTAVTSGQAVLDALANTPADDPFSLLIIDWKMPGMDGLETCTHIRNHNVYSKLPIVLLSGWNPKEFAKQAQGKIDGVLSKPITAPSLFNAITKALGPHETTEEKGLAQSTTAPKSKGKGTQKLLVAEDNIINQEVALQILTKAGFSVKIVHDGREAIDAFKKSQENAKERFAAILMDIQMPGVDGFEATKQIRQLEKTSKGDHAIPIIAMTAQAFAEDRDKCFAVGMDDFISKPFEQDHLFSTLARHTKNFQSSAYESHEEKKQPTEGTHPTGNAHQTTIDKKDALRRIGGKEEFLNHLFTIFRDDYTNVDDLIIEAFKNNDTEKAIRLAHTISGAAANLSAVPLAQSAKNLQITIEKNGNFEEAYTLFSKDLKEMIAAINELVPQAASPARGQSETTANQDELAPLFDELISLLEMNSYKVTETVQQIKAIIPASYQDERLSTLYRHIDNFEYGHALEIATILQSENIPTS